jgi:hypothetical protein
VDLSATHTAGVTTGKLKTLLKSPGASDPNALSDIKLEPYGVYIGELR